MKFVWLPEQASKAFIATVKSCGNVQESGVPELLSALAAGWNAKMIVETWSHGCPTATSVGLAVAASCNGGRHVCVVPDERSRSEYLEAVMAAVEGEVETNTEMIVEESAEKAVEKLEGVDFLVVDSKRSNFARVLKSARLGSTGGVLTRKNVSVSSNGFRWSTVLGKGNCVTRSVMLPVGRGLDIAYIDGRGNKNIASGDRQPETKDRRRRWIKHVDQKSGEVHMFRG